MDATDQTIRPTISPTMGRNRDHLDVLGLDVLGDGPLGVPVWRLWEGLDALMRAGRLRGVALDLAHPSCPCFLLDVAPGLPRLYVEVFLDDAPEDEAYDPEECDPEEEWRPLLVLVNWLGEDTDPAVFELGAGPWGPDTASAPDAASVPDVTPVLDHVLWMAQSRAA